VGYCVEMFSSVSGLRKVQTSGGSYCLHLPGTRLYHCEQSVTTSVLDLLLLLLGELYLVSSFQIGHLRKVSETEV
jgi:hypothetical protein